MSLIKTRTDIWQWDQKTNLIQRENYFSDSIFKYSFKRKLMNLFPRK